MSHLIYKGFRTGFPFPVPSKAEDGEDISVWDGVTLFEQGPSKSATENITVVGPGTEHSIGYKRHEVAELYWRIRHFKFDWSGLTVTRNWDGGVWTPIAPTSFIYGDGVPPAGEWRTRELELLRPGFLSESFYDTTGAAASITIPEDPPVTEGATVGISVSMFQAPYHPLAAKVVYCPATRLFYPAMQISFDTGNGAMSSVRERPGMLPAMTIRILGKSLILYADGGDFSSTGSVVVTPNRYWSYGGTYNETTGDRIA